MLYPSIFTNDLFDDIFDDFVRPTRSNVGAVNFGSGVMKTDIKETENAYELQIELPGVKKENLSVELKDGTMEIKASVSAETNDENKKFRYLRQERFYGTCSRSFYVGDAVTQEDIKAKFENGVLTLVVPKIEKKPEVEQHNYVEIE